MSYFFNSKVILLNLVDYSPNKKKGETNAKIKHLSKYCAKIEFTFTLRKLLKSIDCTKKVSRFIKAINACKNAIHPV